MSTVFPRISACSDAEDSVRDVDKRWIPVKWSSVFVIARMSIGIPGMDSTGCCQFPTGFPADPAGPGKCGFLPRVCGRRGCRPHFPAAKKKKQTKKKQKKIEAPPPFKDRRGEAERFCTERRRRCSGTFRGGGRPKRDAGHARHRRRTVRRFSRTSRSPKRPRPRPWLCAVCKSRPACRPWYDSVFGQVQRRLLRLFCFSFLSLFFFLGFRFFFCLWFRPFAFAVLHLVVRPPASESRPSRCPSASKRAFYRVTCTLVFKEKKPIETRRT